MFSQSCGYTGRTHSHRMRGRSLELLLKQLEEYCEVHEAQVPRVESVFGDSSAALGFLLCRCCREPLLDYVLLSYNTFIEAILQYCAYTHAAHATPLSRWGMAKVSDSYRLRPGKVDQYKGLCSKIYSPCIMPVLIFHR